MVNKDKLEQTMLELGFPERLSGTPLLREAVALWDSGERSMTKGIYGGLAAAHGSSVARVERAMRHAICVAAERGDIYAWGRVFGNTINSRTGNPTVGECVARLAWVCHED